MSVMIETDNLGRRFGEITAVDGITFQVQKGEVLGFLGPNGAGKSTTMKMLTTFLRPSFGTARVAGFDVVDKANEVRQVIGYLPENAPLYGEMSVRVFLEFVANVRGLSGKAGRESVERIIERTSIRGVERQRIETLSKGYKRRVALAQALIHDPDILILDEPTDGLDPNQKHDVRTLINQMSEEKCIILSTHILEEVDEVCTRMIIVANGKIVADGDPEELRKKSKSYGAVTISFAGSAVNAENAESMEAVLKGIDGVKNIEREVLVGDRLRFVLYPESGRKVLSSVVSEAETRQWSYEEVHMGCGQLDEVFREITT